MSGRYWSSGLRLWEMIETSYEDIKNRRAWDMPRGYQKASYDDQPHTYRWSKQSLRARCYPYFELPRLQCRDLLIQDRASCLHWLLQSTQVTEFLSPAIMHLIPLSRWREPRGLPENIKHRKPSVSPFLFTRHDPQSHSLFTEQAHVCRFSHRCQY